MADIVERLRARRAYVGRVTLEVMADAIAEIERLRAALSHVTRSANHLQAKQIAKQALAPPEGEGNG